MKKQVRERQRLDLKQAYAHGSKSSSSGVLRDRLELESPNPANPFQQVWSLRYVLHRETEHEAVLAKKLLAIRRKLGASQTEMAKLLDLKVAYTVVSSFEHGKREPDLVILLRYARLVGISTDVLIDDKLKLEK